MLRPRFWRLLLILISLCLIILIFGQNHFIKYDSAFFAHLSHSFNKFLSRSSDKEFIIKVVRNDSIYTYKKWKKKRLWDNNPLIHLAIDFNSWKITEYLLLTSDLKSTDINGLNVLMPLLKYDQINLLRLALEMGADPNQKDKFGLTATLDACALGKLEALKLFVEFKGDIYLKTKYKMDCRILAGLERRSNILTYLNNAKEN